MLQEDYKAFFGLLMKPFELVPNPAFLYMSRTHKKALSYLDYGIREGAGFVLLTGEVGCGKTTLVRNLIKQLEDNIILSKVFNTKVSSEQLISMINDDFGLDIKGKDKTALIKDLYDFLIDMLATGKRPVLIIDEAQNLAPELLEEVRMLSNLETDTSKLLQIVLVGQPELRAVLAAPELRQFRQRISVSAHIGNISRDETELYVLHRLSVAGNREAVTFDVQALDLIYRYSRGTPRLVNIICDFVLLTAFADRTRDVSRAMVADIVRDLEMENRYWGLEALDLPEAEVIHHHHGEAEPIVAQAPVPPEILETIGARLAQMEARLDDMADKTGKSLAVRIEAIENAVKALDMAVPSAQAAFIPEADASPGEDPDAWKGQKKGILKRIFG
ncbi:MAG: XrtA/PEP-CTERM system-associated ATPase [Deltaproteobacteria bacterium]